MRLFQGGVYSALAQCSWTSNLLLLQCLIGVALLKAILYIYSKKQLQMHKLIAAWTIGLILTSLALAVLAQRLSVVNHEKDAFTTGIYRNLFK